MTFTQSIFLFVVMNQNTYNAWRVHKPVIDNFVSFCQKELPEYYEFFKHLEIGYQNGKR